MKAYIFIFFVLALAIPACGTSPDEPVSSNSSYPNPSYPNEPQVDYLPKPEDGLLTRGEAYIAASDLLTMESYPLQFMLNLKGILPTPCHQLRVFIKPPNSENKILVEVYSVSDPNVICAQALSPFEVNVPLGSFAPGYYMLFINGEQAAEFEA